MRGRTDDLGDFRAFAVFVGNTVEDGQKRLGEVEELAEAVEAEVDEMARKLDHLSSEKRTRHVHDVTTK